MTGACVSLARVGKLSGNYNPMEIEKWVKRFWEDNKVYEEVRKKSMRENQKIIFIDGPPYPSSGIPHVGTAWNKVLKDAFLRYWRMRGYWVNDRPGYDCHGLPIEVQVEKKMGVRVKKDIERRVGVSKFINECKKYAINNLNEMSKWFKDLGVFMDWSNPYLTLRDEYIESGWRLIKKADEKGLLDNEERVVYWCPRCSTTLAEYEIVYRNQEDPSIIVEFPLKNNDRTSLLIWTTTPWTLPANMFVMAHPEATYVEIEVKGKHFILAEKRLEWFIETVGVKDYKILRRLKGYELDGKQYKNPLEDLLTIQKRISKYHRVVMAPEFVTMEEGTGLVHSAPGHGFEDYEAGRKIGLKEIVSPIDDEGRFTEEVERYAGLYVRDANSKIIQDLKALGALIYEGKITHRYPTCWRCRTPVVLRATRQWVLRVTRLKNELKREASKVNWIPEWSLTRLNHILDNLQDWVLSRQRYWGTPLPIWVCPNGHRLVVGGREELEQLSGSKPKDLHKPWIDEIKIKCPICGKEMKRIPDVADVWFDSGIAFFASRTDEKISGENVQADFITEGHDQIRGWFFSQLRSGVIGFGKSPYKTVLVHGFVLDEHGREMHKSLGNYVGTDEVIARVGRDPFRLWVLQHTPWEDLRFSWRGVEETIKDLSIAWNVFVFASSYMNLDGFDPEKNSLESLREHLRFEDRWILSKAHRLIYEVTSSLNEYRIHEAARKLIRFIVEDVSRWYIRLIRPRVWIEENTPDKMAAYATLYHVLDNWILLSSPIIPFFTEKVYQEFLRKGTDGEKSVHLRNWPSPKMEYVSDDLEKMMDTIRRIYMASSAARMKAGIKQRIPVKEIVIYTNDEEIRKAVRMGGDLAKKLLNTRSLKIKPATLKKEVYEYEAIPKYNVIGPRFKEKTAMINKYIASNSQKVAEDVLLKGKHKTVIDGTEVVIDGELVEIKKKEKKEYAVVEEGNILVALHRNPSEEEMVDGLARDIVRRIQVMRKELQLPLDAKINAVIKVPSQKHSQMLGSRSTYIANEVRAEKFEIIYEKTPNRGYIKKWIIDGEEYVISIEKEV